MLGKVLGVLQLCVCYIIFNFEMIKIGLEVVKSSRSSKSVNSSASAVCNHQLYIGYILILFL